MVGNRRLLYRELLDWKSQAPRKPLILYEVRQCGKSYLVRQQFGPQEFANFHAFDFKERGLTLQNVFNKDFDTDRILRELSILAGRDIDIEMAGTLQAIKNIGLTKSKNA